MTGTHILDTLTEKLIDSDLPILRKTAASIASLASTTRSDIGLIAQIILQDQPFTARVLRMANSAYYGRAAKGKVTSVTRAILILGFSTIRDMAIAAEYADFAQSRIPRTIDLERLIAKAFFTARQAVLLARALRLPQSDDLFVRTLFSRLGELTMAYYLPDVYADIRQRMAARGQTYDEAHVDIVGLPCTEVTKTLGQRYGIPANLIRVLPLPPDAVHGTEEDRQDWLIKAAGDLSDDLFNPSDTIDGARLGTVVSKYAPIVGLSPVAVTAAMKAAFQQSKDLADLFDLDPKKFELAGADEEIGGGVVARESACAGDVRLKVIDSPAHQETAVCSRPDDQSPLRASAAPAFEPSERQTDAGGAAPAPAEATPAYLPFLMELSAHVLDQPDFNTVVTYLLEGLHRGCGFAHVALVLPHTATKTFAARFGVGPGIDDRLPAFASPADANTNLLMRVLLDKAPLRLSRAQPHQIPLPPALAQFDDVREVALGPLCSGTRSVGLIWADHPRAIDAATWNAFQLFIMQANIALNRLVR